MKGRPMDVERIDFAPDGSAIVDFRPAGAPSVAFLALVRPDVGETWVARFWSRDYGIPAKTFIHTWDSTQRALIVAEGDAFYLRPDDPGWLLDVPVSPVLHLLRHDDLVVLGDFTSLVAVDGFGIRWQSRRIARDGLRALAIDEDHIEGEGYDPPSGTWLPFSVSLGSGEVTGGSFA